MRPISIFIRFFGNFTIEVNAQVVHVPLQGATRELFCILLLNANRELRREKLIGMVWPDRCEASGNKLLSTALWRIRKLLDRFESFSMSCRDGTVCLSHGTDVSSDVSLLGRLVKNGLDGPRDDETNPEFYDQLSYTLSTHDDEFLEGTSGFWVQIERERFFNLRIQALGLLLNHAAALGHLENALSAGRRIIALDPYHECTQRQIMWLYLETGQQAKALLHFSQFEALLQKEMQIAPMAETLALRDLILAEGKNRMMQDKSDRSIILRRIFDEQAHQRHTVFKLLAAAPH